MIDINQLLTQAQQFIDTAEKVLPEIEMVTGMIPGAAPAVAAEQAAGLAMSHAIDVIQFLVQETKKPLSEAFADLIKTITPGMASSPVLK
jgi:hypothetical protein